MHFFLLGASGRTGKLVVTQALARGHQVTALVRDTSAIPEAEGLNLVKGTPLKLDDIENAFTKQGSKYDTVIVTLNNSRESDSPFSKPVSPPTFLADSMKHLITVMSKHGVDRLVVMSTAGVSDSWSPLPLLSKGFMRYTNIHVALLDHNVVDAEVQKSSLNYTLVRPVRLEYDESVKPLTKAGREGRGMSMMAGITSGSVASFLLDMAELRETQRDAVVIWN